jgi:hypothetical protein
VEYSLGPVDVFLAQRVIYHNPGASPYPWMSWSNAALPSAPDCRFVKSPSSDGQGKVKWRFGKNSWARAGTRAKCRLPPEISEHLWAPSGFENLDSSFNFWLTRVNFTGRKNCSCLFRSKRYTKRTRGRPCGTRFAKNSTFPVSLFQKNWGKID